MLLTRGPYWHPVIRPLNLVKLVLEGLNCLLVGHEHRKVLQEGGQGRPPRSFSFVSVYLIGTTRQAYPFSCLLDIHPLAQPTHRVVEGRRGNLALLGR